ncbi:hypothetical protein [uncultured Ruminococcus sp.]|uniref:hypothetical protein n=1 Tax=uncultured Ruminococcus sp. TaxID=165186 RepID=UPI0025EE0B95|nr:hypothetical protein [uncultured Ruminococcus sp.]
MENFDKNSPSDNHATRQHYQRFVKQLSDWYSSEKKPELASEDTRFALELQKQKLHSLGLDMQLQIEKQEGYSDEGAPLSYTDNIFVNSICCNNQLIITSIRDSQKELYSRTAPCMLTTIMQNPKQGGVPSPDTAMCCPHCGAPSTLGRLESGCEFCNTKFLMDELYPKVMHFFISDHGDVKYDTNTLKKHIVRCSIFFMMISSVIIIINMCRGKLENNSLLYEIASRTVASIILGVMLGAIFWFTSNIVGSVKLLGKYTRGASKTGKSLMFCYKMKQLDPTFSVEYFRDKSLSLMKLMVFSRNPQELTICRCDKPIPEKLREIVDIRCQNSGINSYSIRDGVCDVSVTFYTDSLHFRDGKVFPKSDKIRMSLRKVITKPTDLGFSAMAVICPSCGASFDAEKVRDCPFCGKAYPLEENEWVVTDISI